MLGGASVSGILWLCGATLAGDAVFASVQQNHHDSDSDTGLLYSATALVFKWMALPFVSSEQTKHGNCFLDIVHFFISSWLCISRWAHTHTHTHTHTPKTLISPNFPKVSSCIYYVSHETERLELSCLQCQWNCPVCGGTVLFTEC